MRGQARHHRGHRRRDVLRGTRKADVIDGLAGDDRITGLGGNDTICGSAGTDDLRGNGGADRIYGGRDGATGLGGAVLTGDTLRGGPGTTRWFPGWTPHARGRRLDRILYDTSPRRMVVNLARGTATGDGTDRLVVNGPISLTTTKFADRVLGSRFDDSINAEGGADYVSAGAGNDKSSPTANASRLSRQRRRPAIGGPGKDDLDSNGGPTSWGRGGQRRAVRLNDGGGLMEGGPGNDYVAATPTPTLSQRTCPPRPSTWTAAPAPTRSSS